ncbi:MAG TPA: bifunctional shikimate kinase/3-dehydroquinate synthase [Gaiellaceae bacterium]|nr:bifunctional shikimate kinase/3-dehydroquinate synthase [Gaiellaceae bacterium]
MGAGKSTIGEDVARASGRPFVDLDREIERRHGRVTELFERGEEEFRRLEEELAAQVLASTTPAVVALGGGAVLSERTRDLLRARAYTVHVAVDPAEAWRRVRSSDRPLARDETSFRELFEQRRPIYERAADAVAGTGEELVLAALQVDVERGLLEQLDDPGPAAVIADGHVLGLHPLSFEPTAVHRIPRGEAAKTPAVLEQLWNELRLSRSGTIVGYGGGSTTDVAGFAAATYLRGVRWIAVPTTLLGQVDAAIGGKTAIDLPVGKNLVGAFHYPSRVVVDPDVLATLSDAQRREGMAEVVKAGLLAGRPLWELEEEAMIRACASYKAAVCLGDPFDQGRRAVLNLGHTFAHALEAAAGYEGISHGEAVALGLRAALRLSGRSTEVVEQLLAPSPVRADRDRAWAALRRDKKRGLVLLGADGPEWDVELPDADVRRALDELIAD